MKKPVCLFVTALLFAIMCSNVSFAQTVRTDSSSQQNAFNNALNLYYTSIGVQSPIYNGPEYYFYDPHIKGNAYFMDVNAFTSGSIFYDGALYTGVPMLYDLYVDKVVVLLYNHFSKFSLVNSKVKSFDFLDHHFVNISTDSLPANTEIKSGFYDQLYGGKIQVLAKRMKDIQGTSGSITTISENYFNPIKQYYLRKDRTYYPFSGQGGMLSILKDHKKELQQYIKSNKIKFGRDPEDAMVKIASYYDQLSK